jgi:hypothetical protein
MQWKFMQSKLYLHRSHIFAFVASPSWVAAGACRGAKCLNIERHCFYWMPRGICPVGDLNSCCCIREISPRAILFADPADTEFSSAHVFLLPACLAACRCGGFFSFLSRSLSSRRLTFCVLWYYYFPSNSLPATACAALSLSLSFRHPRLLSYLIILGADSISSRKMVYLFKFYV